MTSRAEGERDGPVRRPGASIVDVLLPASGPQEVPAGARAVTWEDAPGLSLLLRRGGERGVLVLVTDGLDSESLAAVAAAIGESDARVIEVRSERWDGETQSPVSGVCVGVISGFGEAGIAAAVTVAREAANPGERTGQDSS